MMNLKQLTIFALLASPFTGFAQDEAYTLQGQVNPKYNGRFMKLIYTPDKQKKVVDSVKISNGSFTFSGNLARPLLGKLSLGNEESGDRVDVFIAGGTTRVSSKDSLRYAQIDGTTHAVSHEKLAKMGLRALEYNVVEFVNAYRLMPEGEAKKQYTPKLLAEFEKYSKDKRKLINQFVTENPDSYVALYHLTKSAPDNLLNYETTFPYYSKFTPAVKETPLGAEFGKKLMASKGALTGEPYKDFVSTTPEGKSLSLGEVISTNKYTLVDFWASWCGPCRKENPYVVKTFEAFKGKGFTVLSVSLDDKADKWKEAIEKDGMPWYHVSSLMGWKEPAAALYNVKAIPMNMLVDAKGKIVATNLRGETLYEKVQSLVK